jgi:hypothetical protein
MTAHRRRVQGDDAVEPVGESAGVHALRLGSDKPTVDESQNSHIMVILFLIYIALSLHFPPVEKPTSPFQCRMPTKHTSQGGSAKRNPATGNPTIVGKFPVPGNKFPVPCKTENSA